MGITAKSFGKDKSLLVKVQNKIDKQKSAKVVRKSQKKQQKLILVLWKYPSFKREYLNG